MAEWGRTRWLWNEAVHQQRIGHKPTECKLDKLLTEARCRNAWLRDGSQNVQQAILRNYIVSLGRSFKVKGTGRPKLKHRKVTKPSLAYSCRGFKLRDGRLCLAKTPPISVVWHRELPSEPKSVRVFRDPLGHWYASFVVRVDAELLPEAARNIGIDWGVTVTATTTDPDYDLEYAGHAKVAAANLAKYQRRMARRAPKKGQKASKGYDTAKRDTAKLHKKVARQRKHAARVWAKTVVADHQLIAVEDFRAKFLAKKKGMAKKAADAGIALTKQILVECGNRTGRTVVLVPPEYTTMTCSNCGARAKHRLELHERTFRCDFCGFIADRDRNAARTILAWAERNPTGVDDVRHGADLLSELVGAVQSELESLRL